jgi:hypothetical protein
VKNLRIPDHLWPDAPAALPPAVREGCAFLGHNPTPLLRLRRRAIANVARTNGVGGERISLYPGMSSERLYVRGGIVLKATLILSSALIAAGLGSARPSQTNLNPRFKSEVSRLASEGLALKEAREVRLDGDALALAAVFARSSPTDPREAYEFRIIESDGQTAKSIFRRTEFFFTLAGSAEMAAFSGTDINGDGFKEVIVQSSSGGNCWSCNPTEIYRIANHKAELIAAGPIRKIKDLDGDARVELLVTDARWEIYAGLSHAASPWATIIYTWRNGRYQVASSDYSRFYNGEIDRLRQALTEAASLVTADESSDDAYVGLAVSLAINCAHIGQTERGLAQLQELLAANAKSPEQVNRRKSILEDFKTGESARKLRAIKDGDPML